MFTATELATKIEGLRVDLETTETEIKKHREALKILVAEKDRITQEIADTKKARFEAIKAEEKAEKIAALKAQLAELGVDVPDPAPRLVIAA